MKRKGPWADHYTHRARKEKWAARSVYKLEEIDKKYHLIARGDRILDLGCYPGSWSQYCLKKTGLEGEVIGVDFTRPEFEAPNFRFMKGDILSMDFIKDQVGMESRDLVLSDMAPPTTGTRTTDASRSLELAQKALAVACIVLRKKGHFLVKLFESEEVNHFRKETAGNFEQVFLIRPRAVRKGSREIYVLGLHFIA